VKNLLDEEYVESNRHGTENFPGLPRTFWARLTAAF
jgi:outer membrane receptor protein involved in Fe transport